MIFRDEPHLVHSLINKYCIVWKQVISYITNKKKFQNKYKVTTVENIPEKNLSPTIENIMEQTIELGESV